MLEPIRIVDILLIDFSSRLSSPAFSEAAGVVSIARIEQPASI
jgi:hypothetical protein